MFLFRSYEAHHRVLTKFGENSGHRPEVESIPNLYGEKRRKGTAQSIVDSKLGQLRRERTVQNVPLWLAAKAATAADLYFQPVKIPSAQGTMTFRDGGFGESNNPCSIGYDELKNEWGEAGIQSVISIGTARRNGILMSKGPFQHISSYVSKWVNNATDPYPVHLRMAERCYENGIFYRRLNSDKGLVPAAMLPIEFDQWKPRKRWWRRKQSGTTTLQKIEWSFRMWIADEESEFRLRTCAEQMVRVRRARCMDIARWERFATGIKFRCPCRGEHDVWFSRARYSEHLRATHGYTDSEVIKALEECAERWEYQPPP